MSLPAQRSTAQIQESPSQPAISLMRETRACEWRLAFPDVQDAAEEAISPLPQPECWSWAAWLGRAGWWVTGRVAAGVWNLSEGCEANWSCLRHQGEPLSIWEHLNFGFPSWPWDPLELWHLTCTLLNRTAPVPTPNVSEDGLLQKASEHAQKGSPNLQTSEECRLRHSEATAKGKGMWAEVGLALQGPGKVCKPQPSAARRSIEETGNLELPNTHCQHRPSSLTLAITLLTHICSGHCGKDETSQAKKQNQGYYGIKKEEKKFPQNFHRQYSKSNDSIWVPCFGHTSLLMWRMEFFSEDITLCLTGVRVSVLCNWSLLEMLVSYCWWIMRFYIFYFQKCFFMQIFTTKY